MAKGASFFGVILVGLGVLLAYLYSSGKWPAVWAAITGAPLKASGNSKPAPTAPALSTYGGGFDLSGIPVPGGTLDGRGGLIPTVAFNPSNGVQANAPAKLDLASLQPYPAVSYATGLN